MAIVVEEKNPAALERFVTAQQSVYQTVIAELQNGNKQTHWMWFVFPQIEGLGTSETAKRYAIKNVSEAKSYMEHPLLGQRLLECAAILLAIENKTAHQILGAPDDAKLLSCMTLFSIVLPQEPIFNAVIKKYFNNKKDPLTLAILKA